MRQADLTRREDGSCGRQLRVFEMCVRIAGPSRLCSTPYPGSVAAVDEERGQAHAGGFFWYPFIRIRTALEPAARAMATSR